MVEDTSISIDMQPIIISLDFGQLSEKCRTNNKINNILKKLKEKEHTLPPGYISVCEVNKLIVLILEEVLSNINRGDEYG